MQRHASETLVGASAGNGSVRCPPALSAAIICTQALLHLRAEVGAVDCAHMRANDSCPPTTTIAPTNACARPPHLGIAQCRASGMTGDRRHFVDSDPDGSSQPPRPWSKGRRGLEGIPANSWPGRGARPLRWPGLAPLPRIGAGTLERGGENHFWGRRRMSGCRFGQSETG